MDALDPTAIQSNNPLIQAALMPGNMLRGIPQATMVPGNLLSNPIKQAGSGIFNWLQKPGLEMQKSADLTQNQLGDLSGWYNSNINQDYMNSSEARSSIATLTEQVKRILAGYNNQAVATGATPEAALAAKTGAQSNMADMMAKLSGLGTQKKENVQRDYMTFGGLLNKQMADIYQNKAAGYQAQQDAVFNGIGDLFGALTAGGTKLMGGLV